MTTFFRFPRTPHLAWLGSHPPRDDKVLSPREVQMLLDHDVVVEEKVDGANVGISLDERGVLQAQNRGSILNLGSAHPQFRPLFPWLAERRVVLEAALGSDLMLFGEWCYAVHSVRYSRLPDWFLAFDVYDRQEHAFWSAARRDAFVRDLDLACVPCLESGHFDLPALKGLLGPTRLGDGLAEGLYIRQDDLGKLVTRAKLVHPSFIQALEEAHWLHRPMETNRLAHGHAGAPLVAR